MWALYVIVHHVFKGFNEIWTDYLPWKTVKNLVEYYYMWKTTDRYVQQKRVKAVESEQKLKQVYVPDYSKVGKFCDSKVEKVAFSFSWPWTSDMDRLLTLSLQVTVLCQQQRVKEQSACVVAPPQHQPGMRCLEQSWRGCLSAGSVRRVGWPTGSTPQSLLVA